MVAETLPQTAPIERTTPIKPSEAIRLGCLQLPVQGFGNTYAQKQGDGVGCAMLAMTAVMVLTQDQFRSLQIPCPDGHDHDSPAWSWEVGPTVVAHLNDDHRWSRSRIADWLEEQGL